MKKGNGKIIAMAILTLIIAVGTLVSAAILANFYDKDFSYTPSYTDYGKDKSESFLDLSSNDSTSQYNENDSQTVSSQESISEIVYPKIEKGIYFNGEDSIVISFYETGFIEGNINCSSITMEFSGQMVENTLIATGTDSLNNTIEIKLIFNDNEIDATSRPTIRYEENEDYLILMGTFVK